MSVFYIITAVIASVALTADFILRYVEHIKCFGFEKELPRIKGKTIPIEELLPENITFLSAYLTVFGISGIFGEALALPWYLTLPLSLVAASLWNFLLVHFILPAFNRLRGKAPAKKAEITDETAVCTEKITADGYGKISVTLDGIPTELNAVSVHETEIAAGETVIVLDRENDVCFVVREDEIYREIE